MRVIAGPEKKTRVMSEKERLITAYHEIGHAIVGQLLENTDPVHKISIISRGQALGYTISLPTEDKFLTTRAELTDTMAMTLGGRAAEEIVFGEITTGASNDLEKVTETAKQMVMRFGMSERLGPRVFGHDRGQPFLGREFSSEPDYSDEIAREIDDEIRRIVESAHQTAKDLLSEKRDELDGSRRCCSSARRSTPSSSSPCSKASREDEVFPTTRSRPPPAEPAPEPERAAARGRPPESAPPPRLRRRRRFLTALATSSVARVQSDTRSCVLACGQCATRERMMGVVNVTPDSFSDGGLYLDPEAAIAHGRRAGRRRGGDPRRRRRVDAAGGGGGRRPRRSCARVEPVVEALAGGGARRSRSTPRRRRSPRRRSTPGRRSSTTSPPCAATRRWRRCCAERGADRRAHAHAGRPADDAGRPRLRGRRRRGAGLPRRAARRRRSPPGSTRSGSGSTPGSASARPPSTTSSCCGGLGELRELGRPLVVGTSRKSFIGRVDGSRAGERLGGTIASSVLAAADGRRGAARPRRRRDGPGADGSASAVLG